MFENMTFHKDHMRQIKVNQKGIKIKTGGSDVIDLPLEDCSDSDDMYESDSESEQLNPNFD